MGIKTIPTSYVPTAKSGPKVQYWLPELEVEFFSPSSQRIELVADSYRQWITGVQGVGLLDSRLKFVPVTSHEVPENYNRTVFCGFVPSYQTQPIDPLVIRGHNLPEFFAKPRWFSHEKKWHVHFQSYNYGNNSLTQGQQKKLAEWFEEQLIYITTSNLLEMTKERYLQQGKNALWEFTHNQQRYCHELENLAESIHVLVNQSK
jgi:hypothetical protein